jgi:nitrite reductase/ring-hydroxylating ferredoxin subunit
MANGPKIRFFFFLTATVLVLVSCNRKENDVIPDTYVNFTLDLNDPEFVNLNTLFGSAFIDQYTNNWGIKSAGFNENGIIIFAGPDEFYAYDRTCPHDYAVNNLSVKVNIVDMIYAECPKCKTRYALTNFGTPTSDSIGRYPLKNYKTSYDGGRYVSVWNY